MLTPPTCRDDGSGEVLLMGCLSHVSHRRGSHAVESLTGVRLCFLLLPTTFVRWCSQGAAPNGSPCHCYPFPSSPFQLQSRTFQAILFMAPVRSVDTTLLQVGVPPQLSLTITLSSQVRKLDFGLHFYTSCAMVASPWSPS